MEELIAELVKVDGIQKLVEDVDFKSCDDEVSYNELCWWLGHFRGLIQDVRSAKKRICMLGYAVNKEERREIRDELVSSLVESRDMIKRLLDQNSCYFMELVTAMQFKDLQYSLKIDDMRFMRLQIEQFAKYIARQDQKAELSCFYSDLSCMKESNERYTKCVEEFIKAPREESTEKGLAHLCANYLENQTS